MIELVLAGAAGMVLHEAAHAFAAEVEGDPTPRYAGRLTLNPLRHLDPVGTVVVPTLCALLFSVPIGWLRPLPLSPSLYRSKWALSRVYLAGPFANAALAVALWAGGFHNGAMLNAALAAFNMIPVPPFDGGRLRIAWRARHV